ncbi:MAG TPA: esterase-like activity of phytase family protein [Ilumatobacteraceae bacterium]|nr:esterase-like activity of phytase family protein [Ilumatobacteraceae bacterium]
MSRRTLYAAIFTAAVAALPAAGAASGRHGGEDDARLLGRAVLPALTVAPGPQSGAAATDANGVDFPIEEGQIVEGFSGIIEGDRLGQFLAMADNGFGSKANSADFLLRAYVVEPDFKTAGGGTGGVLVRDWVQFRDPYDLLDFGIVNEGQIGRLLTGADLDPESIQRAENGDLWVGDEFGPWILHFSADGVLLDPPFSIPGVTSPSNPTPGSQPATIRNSRGFEAMAVRGKYLYAILEGAADPADPTRRVFEFDIRREKLTGREWVYSTETPTPPQTEHFIADAQAVGRHQLVIIERDGSRDQAALTGFKRVYLVDLRKVGADGTLVKHELLDMVDIPDPDGVSLPPIRPDDIGLGDPFSVVCESIEALRPLGKDQLLLACDNNFPNTSRNPTVPDDNEFVVVRVPGL